MKLISWNVNGIRAAGNKGFLDWFGNESADIVGVQEIKAFPDQIPPEIRNPNGYHSYFHPAKKPGYSGTGLFSKIEPENVTFSIGHPEIDNEGRVIVAEYRDFTLLNCYFPNSQRDAARLDYKISFCDKLLAFTEDLRKKGKTVIICGDYNIAHKEIDLKFPKANEGNAGFLPEERAWMDKFVGHGYVDTFRHFCQEPEQYTWWSYRPGIRARNIGWRLDYFCINQESKDRLKGAVHQPKVMGSDHCPVVLELLS